MSEGENQTAIGGWRERARELHEQGGVPQRRAEVVALVDQGLTHAEVASELGLDHRSNVSTHIGCYREQRKQREWLAKHEAEI